MNVIDKHIYFRTNNGTLKLKSRILIYQLAWVFFIKHSGVINLDEILLIIEKVDCVNLCNLRKKTFVSKTKFSWFFIIFNWCEWKLYVWL